MYSLSSLSISLELELSLEFELKLFESLDLVPQVTTAISIFIRWPGYQSQKLFIFMTCLMANLPNHTIVLLVVVLVSAFMISLVSCFFLFRKVQLNSLILILFFLLSFCSHGSYDSKLSTMTFTNSSRWIFDQFCLDIKMNIRFCTFMDLWFRFDFWFCLDLQFWLDFDFAWIFKLNLIFNLIFNFVWNNWFEIERY